MPPPPKPTLPKAAAPRFGAHFDAWNSSSSGHQRPDNQPGTGWRESRNKKLSSQFRNAPTGGARLSDTWGAGSPDWDEKRQTVVPQALKERYTGKKSVADMLLRPGKMKEVLSEKSPESEQHDILYQQQGTVGSAVDNHDRATAKAQESDQVVDKVEPRNGRLFEGVVVYVNGSTFPLVSDHRLKQILSENGGNMSLHLGRRKVTHVILGRPAGGGTAAAATRGGRGAGGGLAGSKLEKEIKRIGGCGVKFVGVEWVLDSLKAGKRLPEARFATLKVAAQGQQSVYGRYAGGVTHGTSSDQKSKEAANRIRQDEM